MEDGSLVQRFSTPHTCLAIGIGFLSKDGDAVVSWDALDNDKCECFVYSLDGPAVSVTAEMRWPRSPASGSLMAVTDNTLALLDDLYAHTRRRLCLIDTSSWTETFMAIPDADSPPWTGSGCDKSQLTFATDTISLIYIDDLTTSPRVLVWNWRTRDLTTSIIIESGGSPRPYLFPPSTIFQHFALLRSRSDNNITVIPLAGAPRPLVNETHGNASATTPLEQSPFQLPAHPESNEDLSYPLPRYDYIARLATSNPSHVDDLTDSDIAIGIVESRPVHLNISAPRGGVVSLLSDTADVIVRVDRAGIFVGPVRSAQTTSERSPQKRISASSISFNGCILACGYEDGLIEVYDLDSGSRIPKFSFQLEIHEPTLLNFILKSTHIAVWGNKACDVWARSAW